MFGLGRGEIILIFLLVLLLFGGKKLPEVAKGLGKAMREYRKARDEFHDTVNHSDEEANDPEANGNKKDKGDPAE